MKKFFFVAIAMLVSMVIAGAQTTKVSDKTSTNGTSYVSSSSRTVSNSDVKTTYTWSNEKDNVSYDIYLHKYTKGEKAGKWTAYVFKTSKKTGKEYKYYLPDGEAIAQDILRRSPNLAK